MQMVKCKGSVLLEIYRLDRVWAQKRPSAPNKNDEDITPSPSMRKIFTQLGEETPDTRWKGNHNQRTNKQTPEWECEKKTPNHLFIIRMR